MKVIPSGQLHSNMYTYIHYVCIHVNYNDIRMYVCIIITMTDMTKANMMMTIKIMSEDVDETQSRT